MLDKMALVLHLVYNPNHLNATAVNKVLFHRNLDNNQVQIQLIKYKNKLKLFKIEL